MVRPVQPNYLMEGINSLSNSLSDISADKARNAQLALQQQQEDRLKQRFAAENAPANIEDKIATAATPEEKSYWQSLKGGGPQPSPVRDLSSSGMPSYADNQAPGRGGLLAGTAPTQTQPGLTEVPRVRADDLSAAFRARAAQKLADSNAAIHNDLTKAQTKFYGSKTENTEQKTDNIANGLPVNGINAMGSARTNQQITAAGKAYDSDKILNQITQTTNSLHRAKSLTSGKIPLTDTAWKTAQQDLANAVANGGAATEGKVNRELINTVSDRINHLLLTGGSINDLRKSEPELIDNFNKQIDLIEGDYKDAGKERVHQIGQNYLNTTDPNIIKTSNAKKDVLYKRYGGAHPDDASYAQYAKANGISVEPEKVAPDLNPSQKRIMAALPQAPQGYVTVFKGGQPAGHIPLANLDKAKSQGYSETP